MCLNSKVSKIQTVSQQNQAYNFSSNSSMKNNVHTASASAFAPPNKQNSYNGSSRNIVTTHIHSATKLLRASQPLDAVSHPINYLDDQKSYREERFQLSGCKRSDQRMPSINIVNRHEADSFSVERLSLTCSKEFPNSKAQSYTQRLTNLRTQQKNFEQLTVITLSNNDDVLSKSNTSQQLKPDRYVNTLNDIWLMVIGVPFNSKSQQRVYEVCSKINDLQGVKNRHFNFINQLVQIVGGADYTQSQLLDHCRETVECLMRVDEVKEQYKAKIQEYLTAIDELQTTNQQLHQQNSQTRSNLQQAGEFIGQLTEENDRIKKHIQYLQQNIRGDPSKSPNLGGLDHLEKEILNGQIEHLKQTVLQLQEQKSQLIFTIQQDVVSLKTTVQELLLQKVDLIKKLLEAENYIKVLKTSQQSETSELKSMLEKQRRLSASLNSPRPSPHTFKSPPHSSNIKLQSPTVNLTEQLEQFLSKQSNQKFTLSQRLFEAQTLIGQLRQRYNTLQEYCANLEDLLAKEKQERQTQQINNQCLEIALQQIRDKIDSSAPRSLNILNNDAGFKSRCRMMKKQRDELLVFFQDLLESLVIKCAQQNMSRMRDQVFELLKVVKQRRSQENSTQNHLSSVTSPRNICKSPYASPNMLSPQMSFLKASKSVQKLALRSDQIAVFYSEVEKLFQQFAGHASSLMLDCLQQFIKELYLYPYHANLYAMTEKLVDSLKGLVNPTEQNAKALMHIQKMDYVFKEFEAERREFLYGRLPTVTEDKTQNSQRDSLQPVSRILCTMQAGVQVNLEGDQCVKIEALCAEIRYLQGQAEVFRDSLNCCLAQTESPNKRYLRAGE